jgi:hypothetical protein
MYNNEQVRVSVYGDDDEVTVKPPVDLFQIFWIGLFVCSSCYSFVWDVFMDWGLGRREFNWLGPRLMFPHQGWYYIAIFADIFLRFLWVTSLVPPDSGAVFAFPNYLTALVVAAEILRRTMWGFFRLEQEVRVWEGVVDGWLVGGEKRLSNHFFCLSTDTTQKATEG